MKTFYLAILIIGVALLCPTPSKAQTPPSELSLFDTWVPIDADSIGTGVRLVYVGATAPADSAEVAYGQSGNAAAYIALINGEVWAKTLTGGTFPVSVELGEAEYYVSQNPEEWERLQAIMLLRETLGFIKYFRPTN